MNSHYKLSTMKRNTPVPPCTPLCHAARLHCMCNLPPQTNRQTHTSPHTHPSSSLVDLVSTHYTNRPEQGSRGDDVGRRHDAHVSIAYLHTSRPLISPPSASSKQEKTHANSRTGITFAIHTYCETPDQPPRKGNPPPPRPPTDGSKQTNKPTSHSQGDTYGIYAACSLRTCAIHGQTNGKSGYCGNAALR
ncbi:hypothetical protein BDV95DRAFT_177492 [Massariosphaeria phaeospora]|uniref:Uncharacterized protein n=1 Tax=Massariosphaeria phaeospora TaxID=100035 RepID=A0A7C8MEA7_9PLEO|nr:hypothetical protein BDV95DRAFT_177492 [Massariosphaeria phaeospora]